jgi:hypothetical protein
VDSLRERGFDGGDGLLLRAPKYAEAKRRQLHAVVQREVWARNDFIKAIRLLGHVRLFLPIPPRIERDNASEPEVSANVESTLLVALLS